jgi:hypothetical protein
MVAVDPNVFALDRASCRTSLLPTLAHSAPVSLLAPVSSPHTPRSFRSPPISPPISPRSLSLPISPPQHPQPAWNSDELPIYEPGLDEVVKGARGT